jgi:hypothetical protein
MRIDLPAGGQFGQDDARFSSSSVVEGKVMMAKLSRCSIPLLLAGCAAAPAPQEPLPQQQEQPPAAQEQAPPAQEALPTPPPAMATGCAAVQPWTRASRALGRPVVETTSVRGRPVYTIKGVSYADIMNDRELTEGVRLIDRRGLEPAPTTVFNIVWTADDITTGSNSPSTVATGCAERYSAPSFLDMH